jgi:hypothetical protein
VAQRWSWEPVIYSSFLIWAAAQFGLRAWVYRHSDLFGLHVPENSTGAFDLFAWQLLWIVGLALGTIYAEHLTDASTKGPLRIPPWLLHVSMAVAAVFLVLRYCPADKWIDPNVYGWLVDKWHLAPARIIDFSAIALLLVSYGSWIALLPVFRPLARLGQASIEVFSVHVLCCIGADALSHDADPNLPWWQQIIVLVVTISAMFLTARAHQLWVARRHPEKVI